jgi:hypothetical protein
VTTVYGSMTFTAVQPGKTVSQAISTRLAAVDAGFIGVTATASTANYEGSAAYDARSCG